MARGGDEVKVGANSGLRRMNVAEVVRPVDDPEVFVAGGKIQNFLMLRQHNERRETDFGVNRNNILLRVLDRSSAACFRMHRQRSQNSKTENRKTEIVSKSRLQVLDACHDFSPRLSEFSNCKWDI